MTHTRFTRAAAGAAVAALALIATPRSAGAQALGTFRWQLQPYCNVVTLAITHVDGVFRLDGADDQCGGGADKASAVGAAMPNPDGTIGFGLTIVTSPGGRPVHVDAALAPGAFDGTWRDSAGHSGTFALTPGASVGGAARPLPAAPTAVPPAIRLRDDGGLVATGTPGSGASPASGAGTRLAWHPGKAALRTGRAQGTEWDDAAVGRYSVAAGDGTRAEGVASTALGLATSATGQASLATGDRTVASGFSSVAGGELTSAGGTSSVALGLRAVASGDHAIAAGTDTTAGGNAALAMGDNVSAMAPHSVALGSYVDVTASSAGTFIFGDRSTTLATRTQLPNQFIVRAVGGVSFRSSTTTGVNLLPGAGAWSTTSDVDTKEHFRDIDGDALLAKIAALPVREWSYRAQDPAIRHMGPTSQDFQAAFGLGEDPRRISTIDADGVALAGVKALESRQRGAEDALRSELARLRDEVASLRAMVAALAAPRP